MANAEPKTDEANAIVKKYMLAALVPGLVPLPLIDLAALAGIQLKLVHSLAKLYDVEFSEQLGKSLIASLLGGGIPVSLSANLASLIKGLPLVGTVAGGISVAVCGGASTYAVGKVFIQHFESGGTLLNFDPQQMRDYYTRHLKEGKEEVRDEVKKSFAGIKP